MATVTVVDHRDTSIAPIVRLVDRFVDTSTTAIRSQLRKISETAIMVAIEQDEAFAAIAKMLVTKHGVALRCAPVSKILDDGDQEAATWIVEYESGLVALLLEDTLLSDLPAESVSAIWVESESMPFVASLLALYGEPWASMAPRVKLYI